MLSPLCCCVGVGAQHLSPNRGSSILDLLLYLAGMGLPQTRSSGSGCGELPSVHQRHRISRAVKLQACSGTPSHSSS